MKKILEKFLNYVVSWFSRKFILKLACIYFGWKGFEFVKPMIPQGQLVYFTIVFFAFLLTVAGLYSFANIQMKKILNGKPK